MRGQPVTLGRVRRVLVTLDARQFAALHRVVLRVPADQGEDLPPGVVLAMGVYEWLLHLGFLSDAEARAVVTAALPNLEGVAAHLDGDGRGADASCFDHRLTVNNDHLAQWTGSEHADGDWFDVTAEEFCRGRPAAETTFVCHLAVLYARLRKWLERLPGRPADEA